MFNTKQIAGIWSEMPKSQGMREGWNLWWLLMMVLQFTNKFKSKLLRTFTPGLFPFVLFLFVQGLSMRQIRFRFDGQPINETDTPAQVNSTGKAKELFEICCKS